MDSDKNHLEEATKRTRDNEDRVTHALEELQRLDEVSNRADAARREDDDRRRKADDERWGEQPPPPVQDSAPRS